MHKEWLLTRPPNLMVLFVLARLWLTKFGIGSPKTRHSALDHLKILWSHLGADVANSDPTVGLPENAGQILGRLGRCPAFLTVGTIEPRKGHAQLLSAFELLWEEGVDANLVIVGKLGWMVESLGERLQRHPQANKRLFWLDGISDGYLEKVYAASS